MLFQRGVEIVDVSGVMLVVVDPHGLFVNVRLQCLVVVWKGGKGKRHDQLLMWKLQYFE